MFERLRFPTLFAYVTNFGCLLLMFYAVRGSGSRLAWFAVAVGMALGAGTQALFRVPLPMFRIGLGACLGAFTLWIPVVLATSGFALIAAPFFPVYGVVVALSTKAMHHLRYRH